MTKKTRLIILLTIVGLLTIVSSALAAPRASWPDTPGGYPFPDEGIPELIRYFYEWGIALGGLLVFIALLIAGFQYMSSTGNPAMMQEAKDRIKSAFIGLVLLLGSWLILNTINPQLTNFPELVLDLSKVVESTVPGYADRSPYPCEWAYVYGKTDYQEEGGYMEPGETADQSWEFLMGPYKHFYFENDPSTDADDVSFIDPLSIKVWRTINCFGCTNCNEEYDPEDELILPINQAIAVCENDKLAAMTPAELEAGDKPECDPSEIIALVEEDLLDRYTFTAITDPVRGDTGDCPPYSIKDEVFDIDYDITLPQYYVSDGNCTLQLYDATAGGSCGDRISEIYGTCPDIEDNSEPASGIECVALIAVPSGKERDNPEP